MSSTSVDFKESYWNKLISFFFLFYTLSLPLSMAGMEAFSWAGFVFFLCGSSIWYYRYKTLLIKKTGFEWPLFGYWGAVALGAFFISDLNTSDVSQMLGSPRWILLFFVFLYGIEE